MRALPPGLPAGSTTSSGNALRGAERGAGAAVSPVKTAMSCGLPLSRTSKSSFFRSVTARPLESCATTLSCTRVVVVRRVTPDWAGGVGLWASAHDRAAAASGGNLTKEALISVPYSLRDVFRGNRQRSDLARRIVPDQHPEAGDFGRHFQGSRKEQAAASRRFVSPLGKVELDPSGDRRRGFAAILLREARDELHRPLPPVPFSLERQRVRPQGDAQLDGVLLPRGFDFDGDRRRVHQSGQGLGHRVLTVGLADLPRRVYVIAFFVPELYAGTQRPHAQLVEARPGAVLRSVKPQRVAGLDVFDGPLYPHV